MFNGILNLTRFNRKIDLFSNYGKLLYKTNKQHLFLINSSNICSDKLSKPDCQRLLCNDQVNKIYNYQIDHYEKYGEFFFTNPITIGILNEKYYIIDGQHRLKCIEMLNYKCQFDVLINVLQIDSEDELDKKYIAINQNIPVPLPENIEDWKLFGRHVEEYISNNYSVYFSNSEKPNSPNFNKQKFIEYINENKIADKVNNNFVTFNKEIENLNEYYKNTYSVSILKNFNRNIIKQIEKSKAKQPHNPLLLSLYKNFEWVDRIVYKLTENVSYENMEHLPKDYRVKIKPKLKREVWGKYFEDSLKGNCIVCVNEIDYDNFHCGHIKSVFYGGETTLSNLEPICASCNLNMGTQDLNVYKKELGRELELCF